MLVRQPPKPPRFLQDKAPRRVEWRTINGRRVPIRSAHDTQRLGAVGEGAQALYNPYHDAQGRFTSGPGGGSLAFEGMKANKAGVVTETYTTKMANGGSFTVEKGCHIDTIKSAISVYNAAPSAARDGVTEVRLNAKQGPVVDRTSAATYRQAGFYERGRLEMHNMRDRATDAESLMAHEISHALHEPKFNADTPQSKSFNRAWGRHDGVTEYSRRASTRFGEKDKYNGPFETFAELGRMKMVTPTEYAAQPAQLRNAFDALWGTE